jgi:hypothetical protein
MEKRQKILLYTLVATQTLIITTSAVFIIGILSTAEIDDANALWQDAQFLFISSTFTLFLVLYTTVLIILLARLKKYYPGFYKKESKQIILVSVSIIVSIISRIVINTVYSIDEVNHALDVSFEEDTWLFPISQIISMLFASIFPIGSIIYSLMYAITHKKRLVKRVQKGIPMKLNQTSRC